MHNLHRLTELWNALSDHPTNTTIVARNLFMTNAGTFEWAAFGTLDDGAEDHAQLHALLHGACMALQLNVTHLTICLDSDLLERVSSICLSCPAVDVDELSRLCTAQKFV